jgi:phosphoserine phosphatase
MVNRASKKLARRADYFYSDSINDLPLLQQAQIPVAVNPDTRLRQLATDRGWRILQLFS